MTEQIDSNEKHPFIIGSIRKTRKCEGVSKMLVWYIDALLLSVSDTN